MILALLALLGTGAHGLQDSPIRVIEDPAHEVVCYWIPHDMRTMRQPTLSCLQLRTP